MRILDFSPARARPITSYESVDATRVALADGHGEAHVYCVRFGPGGRIGEHPTGFGQLFLVIEGRGWVEGGDGARRELAAGQAAWLARGERHAKGSDQGMTAVMIQVRDLDPRPEAEASSEGRVLAQASPEEARDGAPQPRGPDAR